MAFWKNVFPWVRHGCAAGTAFLILLLMRTPDWEVSRVEGRVIMRGKEHTLTIDYRLGLNKCQVDTYWFGKYSKVRYQCFGSKERPSGPQDMEVSASEPRGVPIIGSTPLNVWMNTFTSINPDRLQYGRQFRLVAYYGWYIHAFALGVWLKGYIMSYHTVVLSCKLIIASGLAMLATVVMWVHQRNQDDGAHLSFVIPMDMDVTVVLHLGWCFWASLASGAAVTLLGSGLWYLHSKIPHEMEQIFLFVEDLKVQELKRRRRLLEAAEKAMIAARGNIDTSGGLKKKLIEELLRVDGERNVLDGFDYDKLFSLCLEAELGRSEIPLAQIMEVLGAIRFEEGGAVNLEETGEENKDWQDGEGVQDQVGDEDDAQEEDEEDEDEEVEDEEVEDEEVEDEGVEDEGVEVEEVEDEEVEDEEVEDEEVEDEEVEDEEVEDEEVEDEGVEVEEVEDEEDEDEEVEDEEVEDEEVEDEEVEDEEVEDEEDEDEEVEVEEVEDEEVEDEEVEDEEIEDEEIEDEGVEVEEVEDEEESGEENEDW